MRISRQLQLHEESGYVHKYWKCHNSEFLLNDDKFKELYLDCTFNSLKDKSIKNNISINAFCIMDNHAHTKMKYMNGSTHLSKFMRIAHSKFGYMFNKISQRTGKVANDRPKTPLIENSDALIRVHMYIEANPLRAGKLNLNQLKFYNFSSFKFYAFGIKNKWTKHLTFPDWYLSLGKNLKECQRRYRELFLQYVNESKRDQTSYESFDFIGSSLWKSQKKQILKNLLKKNFNTS